MQRRQTGESVTGAGRTVRILGARHERKCPLCDSQGILTDCIAGNVKSETEKATASDSERSPPRGTK